MTLDLPRSHSAASRVSFWFFLGTILLHLLILCRLVESPNFLPSTGDMRFYDDWSIRILKGEWTDHQAFYGLPGYAFALAAIYSVVGHSPFFVGLIQIVLHGLIGIVIFKIARVSFSYERDSPSFLSIPPSSCIGLLGQVAWTLFLPGEVFSTILMPTVWLVLTYWAIILWILVRPHPPKNWQWLLLGFGCGLMAIMIATILFLIPLLLIAAWQKPKRVEPGSRYFASSAIASFLILLGMLAGVAPAWLHNAIVAKDPVVLSAHSGVNFWIGNHPGANGYPKIPSDLAASQEGLLRDSIRRAEEAAGRKLKRSEVSAHWSAKANAYIHQHPGEWLKLEALKFHRFWNAFQYDDLSIISLLQEEGIFPPGLRFGQIAAFGLAGMILGAWFHPRSRWAMGGVLLHMLALMPVFITERYRLAAVPGLILFASYCLVELWQQLVLGHWKSAAGIGAFSVATAVFVSTPESNQGLWSLDYYNTGIHALESNNLGVAKRSLETAYAYVSDNAEIRFAMGNLNLALGDRTKAKQFYRETLKLNPEHSSALNNLGVLAYEEKYYPAAEKFLLASIAIEPGVAKSYYLLGKVRLAVGDIAGAETAAAEALKLNPTRPEFIAFSEEIKGHKEK